MVTRVRSKRLKRRPIYLCEWREKRGLSQEELAELIGTTKATISRYEGYGKADPQKQRDLGLSTLEALADALKISVVDLIAFPPGTTDDPLQIWAQLTPERRLDAIEMLQALLRSQQRVA